MPQHYFSSTTPSYATVGVTSAEALAAKSNRTWLVLTAHPSNIGIIYINLGATAVINSGKPLEAGDSVLIDGEAQMAWPIHAIADTAAQKLCILEA